MKNTADNASLLREIQHLRAELEELQNEPQQQSTDLLEVFCRAIRHDMTTEKP